jgi:molybdenum cofactor guanylyltransferase
MSDEKLRMSGLSGVVLAGGKSRRLGVDKAGVLFEGVSLLERTVMLAARFCDSVQVVGRDPSPLGLNVPWRLDMRPGLGPPGGIVTALTCAGGPCLVLTCDLPLLSGELLEALIMGRERRPRSAVMTTFLHEKTGFIEPLVAVYEPGALELLESAAERGTRQLSVALPSEVRWHLPVPPGMQRAFFNINYPADLELLRELERVWENSERRTRDQGGAAC